MDWWLVLFWISGLVIGAAVAYAVFGGNKKDIKKAPRRPLSVEVAQEEREPSDDSGAVHRNAANPDKLVDTPDDKVDSLYTLLTCAVERFGGKRCYGWRNLKRMHYEERKGKKWELAELEGFQWLSYNEVLERSLIIGRGLHALGLGGENKLALCEKTRLEWVLTANGCFSQCITLLTTFETLGDDALTHCVQLGEITHLMVGAALLKRLPTIEGLVDSLKCVIYLDEVEESVLGGLKEKGLELMSFRELEQLGEDNPAGPCPPKPEDNAVIMFTAGSTGMPKGVMLSHRNIIANIAGVLQSLSHEASMFNPDHDVSLGYLPQAHVLSFVFHYGAFFAGVPCGFGSPRTLMNSSVKNCKGDIQELQPTVFVGVPQVFEKIKREMVNQVNKSGVLAKKAFEVALKHKANMLKHGVRTPILNKILFDRFTAVLGGKTRFMLSGGSSLSVNIREFMETCFGIPILEGYGLTETSGPATMTSLEYVNTKSVGPPLACNEIKLADVKEMGYTHRDEPNPRGEILIRGVNVARGYYRDEEKTKESWSDGWYASGDIGQWLPDGTLQIIDRKKSLVKGQHGEYIALEKLESVYKENKYVENICVYLSSEHEKCVALVMPEKKRLKELAGELKVSGSFEEMCTNKEVRKKVLESLQKTGQETGLSRLEIIQHVYVDPQEWSTDNEFLSGAMKVRRPNLLDARKEQIDQMYKEVEGEQSQ